MSELTQHGRKALERCIREHQNFIRLADDYDLDEMSVQALQTAIESMQMRLDAAPNPAPGPSEHDESWAEMIEHDYDTAVRGDVIGRPEETDLVTPCGWVLTGPSGSCFIPFTHRHVVYATLKVDGCSAMPVYTHPQPVTPAGGEVVERRFVGVGELERTGYIPVGSAAEREDRNNEGDKVVAYRYVADEGVYNPFVRDWLDGSPDRLDLDNIARHPGVRFEFAYSNPPVPDHELQQKWFRRGWDMYVELHGETAPPVADVVDRVHISNPHDLDPITAYLEDHGGGKGRLTIACYGDAWTGYWGAMGCGLREFLAGCDPSYVTGNLLGLRKSTIRERAYVADIAKELIAALNQRGGG